MKITIVKFAVNDDPEVIEIDDTLEDMQAIVGGYIQLIRLPYGLDMYVNEEGSLKGLPYNRIVTGMDIVGDFFISKCDENGDLESLSEMDIYLAVQIVSASNPL